MRSKLVKNSAKGTEYLGLESQGAGVLEWLEEACEKFRERTAIEEGDRKISYSALDKMANRIAKALNANHLSKGAIIAVILDGRIELIATLIGILRAGCVFVPLDPEFPEERLGKIIADLSPDAYIIQPAFEKLVARIERFNKIGSKVLYWGENQQSDRLNGRRTFLGFPERGSALALPTNEERGSALALAARAEIASAKVRETSEEMCYIYYTSGSTGTPKGIAGKLRGISHFIKWEIETFNIGAGWRFSQFTQPTFDAFLRDIFVPLCAGGTVCIPPEKPLRMGIGQLIEWIDSHEINLIHCVPSVFGAIATYPLNPQKFQSLRYILMAGETLPIADVKKWREIYSDRVQLVNLYGATETTMVKFYHIIQEADIKRGFIPIGKPMTGARAIVLDKHGNICPRGVFGELYIRTPYRTLGYYNNPELTEKVFVKNPFSNTPDEVIYKTGDLARVLNDGTFQLRGRKDNQVKIRGIRVELGEIENHLRHHPIVKSAVIDVRKDATGNQRLVAYLVAESAKARQLSATQWRAFLKQKLPDYSIPSDFVVLDALPLLPNGKVNRRALPAPDFNRAETCENFVAPSDNLEFQLREIWERVLAVRPISVRDNFFDLGGHSILAAQLFAEIEKKFAKNLPLATLFEAPTIEQLANILHSKGWVAPWRNLVAIQTGGTKPPLFCIHAVGGNVLSYLPIASYLGKEQPVYGLQARGLDGIQAPHTKLEEMAADYIKEMRTVQANGPYFLLGHSFGGSLAFEIAQQLVRAGQKIALLAMLDSHSPTFPEKIPPFDYQLSIHKLNLKRLDRKEKARYILERVGWQVEGAFQKIAGKVYKRVGRSKPEELPAHLQRIEKLNFEALAQYVPQVYPGKVTLLRAIERPTREYDDPFNCWGDLAAGGVEVVDVPGHHKTLILEPRVRILCEKLRAVLEKAQTEAIRCR